MKIIFLQFISLSLIFSLGVSCSMSSQNCDFMESSGYLTIENSQVKCLRGIDPNKVISIKVINTNNLSLINFGNLKNLETADLSGNGLLSFPEVLFHHESLKKINLSHNELYFFSLDHSQVSFLEEIDLSHNDLVGSFPRGYFSGTVLDTLDLSFNHFEEIDGGISSFENLRVLNASRNGIRSVDSALFLLPNLLDINLSQNNLLRIPILDMSKSNLKRINLTNCGLKNFPSSLVSAPNLREVFLGHNHFQTVDERIFDLPKLESIQLAGPNFPEEELQRLRLSYPEVIIN